MLPRQILSFFVKGCMYKRREAQNWGALRPVSCDGGTADHLELLPSPYVLSCRIWSF